LTQRAPHHTLVSLSLSSQPSPPPRHLHSFPTRRSSDLPEAAADVVFDIVDCFLGQPHHRGHGAPVEERELGGARYGELGAIPFRSEEHTSELQSLTNLVCRLLLEKKKNNTTSAPTLNAP